MSRAISRVRLIRTIAVRPKLSTQCSVPRGAGLGGARADDDAVFQEAMMEMWGEKKNELPSWNHPEVFVICTHSRNRPSARSPPSHPREQDGSWPLLCFPLMGTWTQKTEGERGGKTYRLGLPQSPLLLQCFRERELSGSEMLCELTKLRTSW